MNFIVAADEKFEAQLNCKIIATTVWKSERDGITTIFVYPYLVQWICTIPSSDFILPLLWPFSQHCGKKPKHVLNVVWISSQKVTKSSQLRTPSLDSYWFLSSGAGVYWLVLERQPEYCAATSPSRATSFHMSGQQERWLLVSTLKEKKVEDPKATTLAPTQTRWSKSCVKTIVCGKSTPQFYHLSKLAGVCSGTLRHNLCYSRIYLQYLLYMCVYIYIFIPTPEEVVAKHGTFSISSACHKRSFPNGNLLASRGGCRGSPWNCLFSKILRLRN